MNTNFSARFPDINEGEWDPALDEPSTAFLINNGLDNLPAKTPAEASHLVASNLGLIAGRAAGGRYLQRLDTDESARHLDADRREFPTDPENGQRADARSHQIESADAEVQTTMTEVTAILEHLRDAPNGHQMSEITLDPKVLDEYTRLGQMDILEEQGFNLPLDASGQQIPITFADTVTKHSRDPEATRDLMRELDLVQAPEAPESDLDRMVRSINEKTNPSGPTHTARLDGPGL